MAITSLAETVTLAAARAAECGYLQSIASVAQDIVDKGFKVCAVAAVYGRFSSSNHQSQFH